LRALLVYCFFFGLLHGILPDEHTWPITFSYAIGSGSGAQGIRTGIYFGSGFTAQRMIMSEISYLALAPFLNSPAVDSVVYVIVGVVMSFAGWILLHCQRYAHLHLLSPHHERLDEMEGSSTIPARRRADGASAQEMPLRWATIHGFIAGFGFGAFTLFVNAVAAPKMPNAWLGFLPGFLFGAGTLVTLAIIGAAFPLGLRLLSGLKETDARRFGAQVGATTLFAGGFLFAAGGIAMALGINRHIPFNFGYVLIVLLIVVVAIPAFVHAWRELKASAPSTCRKPQPG
jgi:sulfite exporter TauE/SafE